MAASSHRMRPAPSRVQAMAKRSDNPSCGALRNRLYRERVERHEAIGRFVITERLISRLVREGELTEADAMTTCGVESGVARILKRYAEGFRER